MDRMIFWLQQHLGQDADFLQAVLLSALIVALLVLVRTLVLRVVYRQTDDVHSRYRWRKTITYTAGAVGLVFMAGLWFEGFESIGTFLGLVAAGLTIALKDLVTGVAGWLFILWRRPFEVGDRIEVGHNRGDVIDVRLFQFTLMEIGNWVQSDQSTGRIIHIPNGQVLNEVVANYSKGFQFIWNEVGVVVTFESNWKRGKELLMAVARKHAEKLSVEAETHVRKAAQKFLIFYTKLTPTVYTSVQDNGVRLTIRYLCRPQNRRGSEEAIWEDVLDAFQVCDEVEFAYPTQRFFSNPHEGKAAAPGTASMPPKGPL